MTTTPTIQIPQQPPDDVLDWLRGKTPEELHAIEAHEPCATCRGVRASECLDCDGSGKAAVPRTLFPESIRYRDRRGKVVEEPALLTFPREDDLLQAAREAVAHVAKLHPKKPCDTPGEARALVGEVRYENLENAAVVALCVRNVAPPHVRAYKLHVMLQTFDSDTIVDVFNRIGVLQKLWSVRVSQLTEAQFWGFCAEVARVENASPLVVLDAGLLNAFVVRQACELTAFRTCKSCSGCSHDSTQE